MKYNGEISKLENELGVSVELLGDNYSIISADSELKIRDLLDYPEVEAIEEPFILEKQNEQMILYTEIITFKHKYNLSGKGVILGIIDSGIDYSLKEFRDKYGNSKIIYYWDQSIENNNNWKKKNRLVYTNDDINRAIRKEVDIPIIYPKCSHGTYIAGICSNIADESRLIVVRVGTNENNDISKSTDFMRAIKFILDKSLELKMPVVINISYGTNEGSHRGDSLFEQYIDEMCGFWKNNICVTAGNYGDKGRHKNINIKDKYIEEIGFIVGEKEKIVSINIWPDYIDDFYIYLESPSNKKTQIISLTSGKVKNIIGQTKIKGFFHPISSYSLKRKVTIQMSSNQFIRSGTWKIVIVPVNVISGNIDIYLYSTNTLNKQTLFETPTKEMTVTVPGTSRKVVTVGSFNSTTGNVSIFSGVGNIEKSVYKPDILAPVEENNSVFQDSNILTVTSTATPYVTGCIALLMEWGIVKKHDIFLYSQKMKEFITKYARRLSGYDYPNNFMGYGFLDLSKFYLNTIAEVNKDIFYKRNRKIKNKKNNDRLLDINNNLNLKNRDIVDKELNQIFKDRPIGGVNILHEPGFEEELDDLNISYTYYKISNEFGTVFFNENNLEDIEKVLSLKTIKRSQPYTRLASLSIVEQSLYKGVTALEEIEANYLKHNPNISINGKGVAISIIDSGIDYLHEAFIYPDGTSKIIYLWDQTKEGIHPKGYNVGVEYTREQINIAIKNNDASLSRDEEGSGTMLGGICAGLKNSSGNYGGVAEEAELIVVKLKKIDGYYNNAMYFAALEYSYSKALELKVPLVLNGSFGSNNLVGINRRILSNSSFFTQGVCEIGGAGNEGNSKTHTSGKINFKGEEKYIDIEIEEDEEDLDIEIYVNRPDRINVGILSPGGEVSKIQTVSNYSIITGRFDFESTDYIISYIYPTTYSGQQRTSINLKNVKKGMWKIKLIGEYITNGIYQIYLPNRAFINPGTKFREVDPRYTINYAATLNDVITVGAYDSINNSLWPNSSRGPTINEFNKPDIVSPGVKIVAPYPGNKYGTITGTSASAAFVSGAVALFMQYTLVDKIYPDKAFVQKIRTYLIGGARKDQQIEYPNTNYGYGLLSIRGMFEQLK